LCLDFKYSATSEEEESVGMVHEVAPIPDPCGEDEGGEV
jgi:hypothetical protein